MTAPTAPVGLHLADDLVGGDRIVVFKTEGHPGAEVNGLPVGRCDHLGVLELLVEVAQATPDTSASGLRQPQRALATRTLALR